METHQAINRRVSVREYKQEPIPKEILEQLVDAGRRAPTARAVEPWEFTVVTDRKTLKRIAAIAPNGRFLENAAACIVVVCQDTKYYLEDGCAACENILLAAADSDLGACWVAGDKKPYADEILTMLGAPAGLKLVSIISLGWPRKKTPQEKNRSLKDVIHWERF